MKHELFKWLKWTNGPGCVSFIDVTLTDQIGDFQPGTKFTRASIEINVQGEGVLKFFIEENEVAVFELYCTIGKRKK